MVACLIALFLASPLLAMQDLEIGPSCISDVWFDVIERKSGNVRARLTTAYYPFRAYRYSDLKKIDDMLR